MGKHIHALAIAAASWLLTASAHAQGDINGAVSDYPDPQCHRPEVKLIKPAYTHTSNIEDAGPAASYNQKVKLYNRQAQDYDACMHAYIDNANVELKRVQADANERIHQITDTANARLKLIESKVAAAVQDANQVAQDEAEKHK
jgi:hypothetical protein